ncbi:hypothetical protein RS75_19630 [Rhizobium nepotum 39/7]|uniref:Uncharacterized protein n=1 Tax=Rhizobium nepotum 39/7 TaxID=1368418 RepID=A0ABR5CNF0_9HYPH|nr:hypothetical protein [Rhizobium nepotum]KJF66216.1 hypothetical protein RS75_19630 [Rhizobium nepotum 39/7]
MLRSIQFDDQHFFAADEIRYVWTKWNLPAEFKAVEASVFQFVPEAVFRIGFVVAEFSGLRGFAGVAFRCLFTDVIGHKPCPLIRPCGPPSPRRGEEMGRNVADFYDVVERGENIAACFFSPPGRRWPEGPDEGA